MRLISPLTLNVRHEDDEWKRERIRGSNVEHQTSQWQQWIPVLENELAVEMRKAPSPSEVHARDHVLRVLRRCIRLGEKLDADMEVLVAAVYLHDLGRHYIADKVHGALSAQKAEPVLERIHFPQEKRDAVLHAIRVHDVAASRQAVLVAAALRASGQSGTSV